MTDIEVKGLDELQRRFERWPGVFSRAMRKTTQAALFKVWERIPAYPPPPAKSTYDRTFLLAKSLGTSGGGQQLGSKPDIFEVKQLGSGGHEGRFGTRLKYAPQVIGPGQVSPFTGYWWTLGGVARGSQEAVVGLFRKMAEVLARWLDGQGAQPS